MTEALLIEKIITTIGKKIINKFVAKLKDQIHEHNMNSQLKEYKKNLELVLHSKYNNEPFYDSVSEIILKNEDKIIRRCFSRNIIDTKTANNFIDELVESYDLPAPYERSRLTNILKNIMFATYITFNTPLDDNTRRMANIILNTRDEILDQIDSAKIDIKELLSSSTSKSDVRLSNVEQEIDKISLKIENLEKQLGSPIRAEEIKSFSWDDYNITLAAKKNEKDFCIDAEIEVDLRKTNFNSFDELLSFLRLKGEEAKFKVCFFVIKTHDGKVLKEYNNSSYNGLKMRLPTIYAKNCPLYNGDFQAMDVIIKPSVKYISFSVENDLGAVVIPFTKYIVTSNYVDGIFNIVLKGEDNKGLIYKFDLQLTEENVSNQNTSHKSNFSIIPTKQNSVKQVFELYRRTYALYNSKSIICIDNDDNIIFETEDFHIHAKDIINEYKSKIDILRRLIQIENVYNLSINMPVIIEAIDIEQITFLSNVIEKGYSAINFDRVIISENDIISKEKYDSRILLSNDINFIFTVENNIYILDTRISLSDDIKIAVHSNEPMILEDGKFIIKSNKAYIFDEARIKKESIFNLFKN